MFKFETLEDKVTHDGCFEHGDNLIGSLVHMNKRVEGVRQFSKSNRLDNLELS